VPLHYKEQSLSKHQQYNIFRERIIIYSEKYISYIGKGEGKGKGKGKAVSLQAWSGPEGSRKLLFPDFMTSAQDGGKVFNLTYWPTIPPGKIHLVLISVRG